MAKKTVRRKATDPKMLTIRKDIDLSHLNSSPLSHVIKTLQELADSEGCDPDLSHVEFEYERGYYDELSITLMVHAVHERLETEKEVEKRIEQARKTRESRKRAKEEQKAKEIMERDRLLERYPLDTVPPVMD